MAVESALPDQRHSGGMVEVVAVAPGVAELPEHASHLVGATAENQRQDIRPVESAATAPLFAHHGVQRARRVMTFDIEIAGAGSTRAPVFDRAQSCRSTSAGSVSSPITGERRDAPVNGRQPQARPASTSSGRGTTAAFTEGKSTVLLAGTGLGVRFPKGKSGPNFRNRPSPPGACKSGISAPKIPYDLSSKVAEKFPKGKSCKLLYTGIASDVALAVSSAG